MPEPGLADDVVGEALLPSSHGPRTEVGWVGRALPSRPSGVMVVANRSANVRGARVQTDAST
eukprot:1381110-Pyramimonas_sp.AAC.1